MDVVKDYKLTIGETLNIGLNPAHTDAGRGIKRQASVLRISTARATVGADLLVGKIRLCQLNPRPTLDASPS